MVFRMLTINPRLSFKAENRNKSSIMEMPNRMPAFLRVDALNNHAFLIGNEEYEFVNGQYYKRIGTLYEGDSFG